MRTDRSSVGIVLLILAAFFGTMEMTVVEEAAHMLEQGFDSDGGNS